MIAIVMLVGCHSVDPPTPSLDTGCASVTCYRDTDADGAGDPARSRSACVCPAGWVQVAGDCDDTDPTVFTDATELCHDSQDNNCDGLTDCEDVEACKEECVEDCHNGIDDDLDGRVDCEDGECFDECRERCDNGVDDDQDGLIDCEDPYCRSFDGCQVPLDFAIQSGRASRFAYDYSMGTSACGVRLYSLQGTIRRPGDSTAFPWSGTLEFSDASFGGAAYCSGRWSLHTWDDSGRLHMADSLGFSFVPTTLFPHFLSTDHPMDVSIGQTATWRLEDLPGMPSSQHVSMAGVLLSTNSFARSSWGTAKQTDYFELLGGTSWSVRVRPRDSLQPAPSPTPGGDATMPR